ncbi:phosphonate C-P lyase system protein PhnL [uncultured Enterovirga sp.]|uniref:phosphonate C-P lyase system protein PhnL n=1 Tax=uncultured Enterovirga sp. TaxID=2026352 RepID=UPI0035CB07B6
MTVTSAPMPDPVSPALTLDGVAKSFVLHLRGGASLPVVRDVGLEVRPGECVVLGGPSGAGKSSILKMIYGNYRIGEGRILVRDGLEFVDVATTGPRRIMALRRTAMAYVSQFLRVIPRVPTLDVVVEPLLAEGFGLEEARGRARDLLRRLNLPARLWSLPPATFSGGEQARVNIARGFAPSRPILLLDEPTASLDAENRAVVADLVAEKKQAGTAILAIFHDEEMRDRVADRIVDVARFAEPHLAHA